MESTNGESGCALRVVGIVRETLVHCPRMLTVGLSIGANSAIFSIVDGVLPTPLRKSPIAFRRYLPIWRN